MLHILAESFDMISLNVPLIMASSEVSRWDDVPFESPPHYFLFMPRMICNIVAYPENTQIMTASLFFCCVITECRGTHYKTSATTTYHMTSCAVCCHSSIWWWPMRLSAHWSTSYVTTAELERIECLFLPGSGRLLQ